MITTQRLGNGGRLANHLFHYASLIGIADRNGHSLNLPEWDYAKYFSGEYPNGYCQSEILREKHFHYYDLNLDKNLNYSIEGYYQSVQYWQHCENKVRTALSFTDEFYTHCRRGYDLSKISIAIHIRRQDFVSNQAYYQLPITYFYNALEQWTDWRECNIIIFSDDIEYCKVHFKCLPNVQFAQGNDIEDLCLMSQCDRFILSNSSYSWWAAYLSGSKDVIRPDCLFDGEYAKTHNDKDFWIPSWDVLSPNQKINLSDVTFVIPVVFDHPDRMQNLKLCLFMLQNDFETNIIIGEQKSQSFAELPCDYIYFEGLKIFHRTKMLNELFRQSKTNIVFNWDADVFISPIQIAQSVHLLRSGIELVYPYDGTFARMPREQWLAKIKRSHDIGIAGNHPFKGTGLNDKESLGGAVGILRDQYLAIGGENENFISFGAEDLERRSRAEKMGLKVERVKGALYHLDHWIGVNSSTRNPYFLANREEFYKVDCMDKEELTEYIKSWK